MLLYNISIALYARLVGLVGRWNEKARLWYQGRKNIFERMQQSIKSEDKVVWIHVASLGEFEQGRPFIEQIRKQNLYYKILVTFFSP
ncbi:MAG: 3-deoxy-D-manno-octulosonic acid transferase, partial [Alistipes sp.]|nr:3-deoxy-D-manno-octulosonic acid transferase [Alistipes sp.]